MPPALGSVALELQLASSEETSKFAGAVAVILPVKADPVTVTEVEADDVPVKQLSAPTLPKLIEGVEPLGVPLTARLSAPAPTEFTALIFTE
jgi:hypothetical protein